jgi:hypothetical protein
MAIHLFLAHANNHKPVLPKGISKGAEILAPPQVSAPSRPRAVSMAAPPNSLPEQRWGIIAPKGEAGDRLLQLVEPLRLARSKEQDEEALIYRVDPDMDPNASAAWIQREYWDEVGRREEPLPRYLAILGGPDLVSWNLQQALGGESFVGRIAFSRDSGYKAYVEKVLRSERSELAPGAQVLFYTARDGSRPTVGGYKQLMCPSLEIARDTKHKGKFPAADIMEIADLDEPPSARNVHSMLRAAERARASVLFSMSHGAGAPKTGWRSLEEQRANQGAMVLDRSGNRLAPADVSKRPFLPDGLWLFFACFGAGTPAHSAYYPWLVRLHKLGFLGSAEHVLDSLPKQGEPPFVAALPQAALENPDGPLGVIGHVDLAWSWSFLDHDRVPGHIATHRRAERFQGILKSLVQGNRLGVAHYELVRFSRSISVELLTLHGENARRGVAFDDTIEADTRAARRAELWLQYQDLSAYVLLGDPAARLPIALRPPGLQALRPSVDTPPPDAPSEGFDLATIQGAVMETIRGVEAPSLVAARYGITDAQLKAWVSAFLDAGNAALKKLR